MRSLEYSVKATSPPSYAIVMKIVNGHSRKETERRIFSYASNFARARGGLGLATSARKSMSNPSWMMCSKCASVFGLSAGMVRVGSVLETLGPLYGRIRVEIRRGILAKMQSVENTTTSFKMFL